MSFWFNLMRNAFLGMLQLLSFGANLCLGQRRISNYLNIYVKTNTGNTLSVELNPKWDIKNLKEIVAPKMGMAPEDIKIIFAGKELHNSIIIEECDLGQQSILHAVRTPYKKFKNPDTSNSIEESTSETTDRNDSGSKPMNEILTDLSFNASDQQNLSLEEQKENRAHFYIYCSGPCKTVTVGKLRVKCARCNSGAVTVDRDPQYWPDVLEPNRITVHCENDFCPASSIMFSEEEFQVTFAHFYFKCAKHASLGEDDKAIPLYLIKANLKNIPCLACTDIRDTVLVFSCEASHVTCLDCFRDYCTVRLRERQFEFDTVEGYYTLPCPAGCSNSFIREIHHFHLLNSEMYERYQRFGAEEYVLRAGGLLCPMPDCGMGIIPPTIEEQAEKSDDQRRRIQCIGGCGYVFCRICLQGYHTGKCELQPLKASTDVSFRNYLVDPMKAKDAKWDEASRKTIQISTKPCPMCRTPTERDGGCMHIVCMRAGCGYHWCWVCQMQWTRECMANHWFG
ncbi:PREDICTED: E3 ubiquitin-protein ligase parkin [Dinoponera quadriceps]|uniref:E3 ubiquitin-protein ligase parkin n=1 Tax=Dinoponera quadriceps TaxID=609295 RepID=A0A6P3YBU6_DINQU|nr:PREDICTED: E3 ubiquitin-protein ligase parkin [Dinoponera quadriceps]